MTFAELALGTDAFGRTASGDVYRLGDVTADPPFSRIAASWYHTCGVTMGGLVCWGRPDLQGFPWYSDPPRVPVYVSLP